MAGVGVGLATGSDGARVAGPGVVVGTADACATGVGDTTSIEVGRPDDGVTGAEVAVAPDRASGVALAVGLGTGLAGSIARAIAGGAGRDSGPRATVASPTRAMTPVAANAAARVRRAGARRARCSRIGTSMSSVLAVATTTATSASRIRVGRSSCPIQIGTRTSSGQCHR